MGLLMIGVCVSISQQGVVEVAPHLLVFAGRRVFEALLAAQSLRVELAFDEVHFGHAVLCLGRDLGFGGAPQNRELLDGRGVGVDDLHAQLVVPAVEVVLGVLDTLLLLLDLVAAVENLVERDRKRCPTFHQLCSRPVVVVVHIGMLLS